MRFNNYEINEYDADGNILTRTIYDADKNMTNEYIYEYVEIKGKKHTVFTDDMGM